MSTALASYVPTEPQRAVHGSPARIDVITGAIRSGKTLTAAVKFTNRVFADIVSGKANPQADRGRTFNRMKRPRLLYYVVAPIHRLLKEARAYILALIPETMYAAPYLTNEDELWLKTPTGDGFVCIAFRSADNPHALVSSAVDGLFIDEAARVERAAWEQSLYGRLVQTRGWAVIATSPFGGRGNWVYELLIARAKEDAEIAAFTLLARDNPTISLEAMAAARRHLPPKFYARDFEGDWSTFGAQVFEEWDPARHVVTEKELRVEYGLGAQGDLHRMMRDRRIVRDVYYGADWGWNDPTALIAVVETIHEEFIVMAEHVGSNMPFIRDGAQEGTIIHEAWKLQREWGKGDWHCDHRPEYIVEFQNHELSARGAYKSIDKGIRVLATLLHGDGKRPRLRVLDSCKQVIKEFGTLAWKLDGNGNAIEGELDDKIPNDATDAVRYALAHMASRFFEDDGVPRIPVGYTAPGLGQRVGFRRA